MEFCMVCRFWLLIFHRIFPSWVVCPNFGQTALTSAFIKNEFLQVKNSFATIEYRLSVLNLFQPLNCDLFFS